MNIVPIYAGNTTLAAVTLEVDSFKQMENKPRIVAVKVTNIKGGVERPEIRINKENFAYGSISPSYYSRALDWTY